MLFCFLEVFPVSFPSCTYESKCVCILFICAFCLFFYTQFKGGLLGEMEKVDEGDDVEGVLISFLFTGRPSKV